jgi:pimeloyl-ACP methyl ester carboxylesterase
MREFPLILVHGYPFDRSMWFSTVASLGSNARVIVPDLPGFGRNPPLATEKPSLEAMSMGGYVALAFAEKYPKHLAGLALISSQAAADSEEARHGRRETIKKIRAQGPSVILESLLPKLFSSNKKADELRHFPVEGTNAAGAEGLCWALEAMARRPDRTEVLRALPLPVLVVHGTEDKIIPCAKARELAERCRDPLLIEIPGAGHATPLEAPDPVAQGLARLMSKCRARAVEDLPPEAGEPVAKT